MRDSNIGLRCGVSRKDSKVGAKEYRSNPPRGPAGKPKNKNLQSKSTAYAIVISLSKYTSCIAFSISTPSFIGR